MENRNGLCTDALVSQADGRAEPEAALAMVRRSVDASRRGVTLGVDKGYDIGEFQVALAEEGVLSHVAQKGRSPLSWIAVTATFSVFNGGALLGPEQGRVVSAASIRRPRERAQAAIAIRTVSGTRERDRV